MNYLAPLTLLAALISTALFFSPATARAAADAAAETSQAIALPLLNNTTQTAIPLPAIDTPLMRPEGQVVNDNLAFSYEYRPSLVRMTQPVPGEIEFITLPHIYFGHDGNKLSPEALDILNGAAQFVFENDTTVKRILIHGHANDIDNENYNYRLSDRRAYAVWDYLAGKGIPTGLLVVNGLGESQPIDESWTREGRARNRHIEIQIVQVK
jgi:outer membrane protein OmpA-like peptidoglycan-associated protein